MKKLVISMVLVLVLAFGVFGGVALAKTPPADSPVGIWDMIMAGINDIIGKVDNVQTSVDTLSQNATIMEANGGYAKVLTGSEMVLDMPKPNYGHVSLTVLARHLDINDYVQVNVAFKGDDLPSQTAYSYYPINGCTIDANNNSIATIEFDVGQRLAEGPGDTDNAWQIWVHNDDLDDHYIDIWYNYTITYPASNAN